MFSPDLSGSVYSLNLHPSLIWAASIGIEVCAILYSCFTQRMSFEEDFPYRPEKYRDTDRLLISTRYRVCTMNTLLLMRVPLGVVTVIGPLVAPPGT